MAKNRVDGVYEADPHIRPSARKYATISYAEVLRLRLSVADPAAFSLCMDNKLPIVVFGLGEDGSIARAIRGDAIGTLVAADLPTTLADDQAPEPR
jgi:uridylate kinase